MHVTKDKYNGELKTEIETLKKVLESEGFKVELVTREGNSFVPLETGHGSIMRMRIFGCKKYKSKNYGDLSEITNVINSIIIEKINGEGKYCLEYWTGFSQIDPHYGPEYVTEDRSSTDEDPQTSIDIPWDSIHLSKQ